MEEQEKLVAFKRELSLIVTGDIRIFAHFAVTKLPDYFFEIPASSAGKYHPKYATGTGGLLRHTQAAVRILHELLSTQTFGKLYDQRQKDMMLTALLLHDGAKSGIPKQKYTVHTHPLIVCYHIEGEAVKAVQEEIEIGLDAEQREVIYKLIRPHMGEWNTDRDGNELPLPGTGAQKMVHLADYLASRKILEFNFDA